MIKHLSYLDLTPEQRRKGADSARKRVMGMMSTPFLTGDQKMALQEQMNQIDRWERGELHTLTPPTREPVSHDISIGESVSVSEKTV